MAIRILDGDVVRMRLAEWDTLLADPEYTASAPDKSQSLTKALEIARRHSAKIILEVAERDRISRHHGWIAASDTLLLMEVDDCEYQVIPTSTDLVPAALADLLEVYPRKPSSTRPNGESVPADILEDLLAQNATRRGAAFERHRLDRAWRLSAHGPMRARAIGGVLGPNGHAMLAAGDQSWSLVPVSNRQLWRTLTTVPTKLVASLSRPAVTSPVSE